VNGQAKAYEMRETTSVVGVIKVGWRKQKNTSLAKKGELVEWK